VTSLDDSITFTFAGDMMFGRAINYFFQGNKIFNVMSNLGNRLFWGTDVSMVNLEGPISTTPVVPDDTANNMVFNFPPKSVDVLKWLHIGAVSLANNHSLNQGRTGIEMTRNLLEAQGISPVGDESEFGDFSVKEFSNGSMKLAVITINSLETDTSLETTIKKEKAAGAKVVVFPHWGVEYDTTHNSNQEKLAHQWIDWGADLIIGSHSHVVEDAEVYKGKPIFYSMGNLLFDQNFSQETQEGLIVSGEFTKNSIELVLLPTVSKKYKPELQIGQKKSDIINNFRKELGLQSCDGNYDCAKIELKY
jgi:poly-gamma-glutamate synthesis protein (capsule biosynthesis protein)